MFTNLGILLAPLVSLRSVAADVRHTLRVLTASNPRGLIALRFEALQSNLRVSATGW
jgi:hypothetical protein